MKTRQGFVSNSSSCSYTCIICGEKEEGWDWDIPGDFAECVHGHLFHQDCAGVKSQGIPTDMAGEYENRIPEEECPICRMEKSTNCSSYIISRGLVMDFFNWEERIKARIERNRRRREEWEREHEETRKALDELNKNEN